MNRRQKLIKAFLAEKDLSAKQIVKNYRYASVNSATGTVTHLRNMGLDIATFFHKNRYVKYAVPTYSVVSSLQKRGYTLAA